MRTPAFVLVAAFVASGCTIHVVETASPVTVAEAPRPAPVYVAAPRPIVYERATPEVAPAPVPSPRVVERVDPKPTAPRPLRNPVKLMKPESRPTRLADLSLHRHRGPMKVKLPEPPTRLTSTRVAKAQ